jgi:penicillin-binding protein 2
MGRARIRCSHVHGAQNLIEGIAHSCNVYFISVGLELESEIIARYAKLLGLGQTTHIDLPFEETGSIPSKRQRRITSNRQWYKGDTANYSIGQGDVLITPIQLLRMMTAVAQNGDFVQPHLIRKIGDKTVKTPQARRKAKVKKEAFGLVQKGMHGVVHDYGGTAQILNVDGLDVAGKTGTAQTAPGKKHHAWFVGYTKIHDRDISFCVFLEYGGSSYYAARTARDLLKTIVKEDVL